MRLVSCIIAVLSIVLLPSKPIQAETIQYGWNDPAAVTLYSETEASNTPCTNDCIEGDRYLHLVHPNATYSSTFLHYLAWVSDLVPGDRVSVSLWHRQWGATNCPAPDGNMALMAIWTNGESPLSTTEVAVEVLDSSILSVWTQETLEVEVPLGVTGVVIVARTYVHCVNAGFHCAVDEMNLVFPNSASLTLPTGPVPEVKTSFGHLKSLYR